MSMFQRRARRARRALFLAVVAVAIVSGGRAFAADITVKIDNFAFTPDNVVVKPGDTVTWENGDDIPHSIVSVKAGAFRSKALDTGDKFSFTFATAGDFEFFCGLHPHMKGKVVVAP